MTDATSSARKFADKGTTQAKQTFETVSKAGQESARRLEDTYSSATEGARDFQRKFLAIAQANVDAAFDCARDLIAVTSPSEFIEVATRHAHQQVQAVSEQTKELTELGQKAASQSVGPLTSGFASPSRGMS